MLRDYILYHNPQFLAKDLFAANQEESEKYVNLLNDGFIVLRSDFDKK